MAILVVNCGSSTVKLSVFENSKRIFYQQFQNSDNKDYLTTVPPNITAIGHRFVHGGNKYTSSTMVTPQVISELEKLIPLAPLHNGYCLDGVKACIKYFGMVIPQLLVFDTAFHSTMPEVASLYALPRKLSNKYTIKRYGFHGISHAFLWKCYSQFVKNSSAKVITLHLGNGCSMTAIKDGLSMDTSMGFSPLEGLVMATRTGDIDASLVDFLCRNENMTPDQVVNLFNFESGLLGLSEISWSMEKLVPLYATEKAARLAIDVFCYRIVKYIGAYIAVLGGVDALIFSGGIGENAPFIRGKIIQKMAWYNIAIDNRLNETAFGLSAGTIQTISTEGSLPVFVIATDENLAIAEEVEKSINY